MAFYGLHTLNAQETLVTQLGCSAHKYTPQLSVQGFCAVGLT